MRCLATKKSKIPHNFKYVRIVLPWKQKCAFNLNQETNMSEGWFVYAVLFKHFYANILCFLLKLCKNECVWGK